MNKGQEEFDKFAIIIAITLKRQLCKLKLQIFGLLCFIGIVTVWANWGVHKTQTMECGTYVFKIIDSKYISTRTKPDGIHITFRKDNKDTVEYYTVINKIRK